MTNSMNKLTACLSIIAIMVFAISCSSGDSNGAALTTKDCGKDFACLVASAKDKRPAKLEIFESLEELAGEGSHIKGYFEIKEYEEDSTAFYLRYDQIHVDLDQSELDTLGEMERQFAMGLLSMIENMFKELEGKDADCKVPTDDLIKALETWQKDGTNAISGMASLTTNCKGELVDVINNAQGKLPMLGN